MFLHGGLEALEEAAPVTVSVNVLFAHNSEFEIPGAVQDRLMQEGVMDHGE